MAIPVIFILFLTFVLVFRYRMHKVDKKTADKREEFWENEAQAMFARRKSLDSIDFIKPSCLVLPIVNRDNLSDEILEIERQLLVSLEKPMLDLKNKTNTELKLEYGTANLDQLTEYENNYIDCIKLIYQLGYLLNDAKRFDDAISILSMGIDMNTDLSEHYILLANLYALNKDRKGLEQLIAKADTCHSLLKQKILRELNRLYKTL